MAEIKIETYTDSNAETRFRVVAPNGQITLTPHEGYTRKEDCHRALVENLGAIVGQLFTMDGILVVDEDGSRKRIEGRRNNITEALSLVLVDDDA